MADLETLHHDVLGQVDQLLAVADDPGPFPLARTPVSGWCALEHCEHMVKADESALHQLESALARGRAGEPGRRATLLARVLLPLGWLPRGVAKAVEPLRPVQAERTQVAADLRRVRGRIEALAGRLEEVAAGRGRASHAIFGGLTPGQWLRFVWVHHHHHLKIIRDIRKSWEG